MNERIKQLAKQAGGNPNYKAFRGHYLPPPPDYIHPATVDLEKFAELIVRECANIANGGIDPNEDYLIGDDILKHFGVEE